MSGDDIVTQLRAGGRSRPEPLLCDIAADEIERLRFDCAELLDGLGRKHDYACRMDALAEERLMEVTRLRAERDASRLIISDLTAEVERLRDEMSTMHRTVVHDCCVQVQSERALADQLAEVLRLVAVDSYMLPLGTDEAVDSALDTWQEACRER